MENEPQPVEQARWGCVLAPMGLVAALGILVIAITEGALWHGSFCDGTPVSWTRIGMNNIEKGLITFAAKHKGKYPKTLAETSKYFPDGAVPTDSWGRPFLYLIDHAGEPILVSLGEDGMVGGEGASIDVSNQDIDQ